MIIKRMTKFMIIMMMIKVMIMSTVFYNFRLTIITAIAISVSFRGSIQFWLISRKKDFNFEKYRILPESVSFEKLQRIAGNGHASQKKNQKCDSYRMLAICRLSSRMAKGR